MSSNLGWYGRDRGKGTNMAKKQSHPVWGLIIGGAGGNRTHVLRRRNRSSPGAVHQTFSRPRCSDGQVTDRLSYIKVPDNPCSEDCLASSLNEAGLLGRERSQADPSPVA